ncbi:hypothetical protein [Lysinibacillus sp. 3P01SB]|uniref:hypothetical protein n=1 Tax=Lysinibacillus sp. 3P01SB TaxID=3132284 RepID=UPI0039A73C45
MKKYWLAWVIIALLVGCSDGKDKEPEKVAAGEQSEATENNQEKQTAERQLYEKLSEAVETLGYTYDSRTYEENEYEIGVVHAELVDFDNDGVEEVYALMKGSNYPLSTYGHRNVDNYVHEVWTVNPDGESAMLSFSGEIEKMECSACDMSVSLVEGKDGRTYIKMFSHQTNEGLADNREWIYAKDPNSSETELVVSGYITNSDGALVYMLNDVETDQAAYEAAFAPYVGEERPIIISNAGAKAYGFNYASPATYVGKVLAELAPSVNHFVDNEETKETKKKEEVLQALSEFSDILSINLDKQDHAEGLVMHVIQANNIENETPNDLEMTFDGDTVKEKYRETFGVELDMENNFFPRRDMISQSLITYELGKFYAYPQGIFSDDINREYQDVYKVFDDVYYVTFVDDEFNYMEYSAMTTPVMTAEEMLADGISNWPDEARNWVKPNVQRYAVVKYIDGAPKVQYMGAQNLTDEQLAAF